MAESTLDIVIRLREEASKGIKQIRDAAAQSEKGLRAIGKNGATGLKNVEKASAGAAAGVRRTGEAFKRSGRNVEAFKRETERANKALDALRKKRVDQVTNNVGKLRQALQKTRQATEEAARDFNALQGAAFRVAAIGTAIAAPFILGTKAAAEFSIQIAEIGTLVDDATVSNEELRETVLDLSNEFGQSRADIARGLYQAISSGAQAGAEANEVLRVALITARGGVTSVAAAVNGLSTIINAFGLSAQDAERIADSLFTTVKGGRTTVQELSGFLFQAAPLASTLGVSFEELNAVLQAVTLQGVPTRNAFTQIRAALQGLIRDTPELNAIFDEYGGAAAAIKDPTIGLQGALELVREAAGGSEGAIIKLLGSIEAYQGVVAVTGENQKFLNQALEDQTNAFGAAAAAAAEVEKAFGTRLNTAGTRLTNLFVEIGNTIGPVLADLVEVVGEAAAAFTGFLQENQAAANAIAFGAALAGLVAVIALLGVTAIAVLRGLTLFRLVIAELIPAGTRAAVALTKLRTAMLFFLRFLGPIAAAFTVAAIALEAFTDTNNDLQESIDDTIGKLDDLEEGFADLDAAAQVTLTVETEEAQGKIEAQLGILRAARRRIEREGVGFLESLVQGDADEQLAELDRQILNNEQNLKAVTDAAKEFNEELAAVGAGDVTLADGPRIARELKIAERALEDAKESGALFEQELADLIPAAQESADGIVDAFTGLVDNIALADDIQAARAGQAGAESEAARQERIIALLQLRQAEVERLQKLQQDLNDENKKAVDAAAQQGLIEAAQKEQDALDKLNDTRLQNEIKVQQEIGRAQKRELDRQFAARLISEEEYLRERSRLLQDANDRELVRAEQQIEAIRRQRDSNLAAVAIDPELTTQDRASQALIIERNAEAAIARIEGGIQQRSARLAAALGALAEQINGASLAEIQTQYETFRQGIESEIEAVRTAIDTGDISQALGSQRIAELNQQLASGIRRDLIPAVQEYFRRTQDPQALVFLEELEDKWARVAQRTNSFANQLRTQVEGNLTTFFDTTLQGIDNIGEAFDQLILDIGASIRRLIAQKLSEKLLESLFGGESSVLGGLLASDGGSVRAAGGGYVKAAGGGVMKLADGGGRVRGRGTSTSDSIPAMLSDGEYVVKAAAVRQYGTQFMEAINQGLVPAQKPNRRLTVTKPKRVRFASGGLVGSAPTASEITAQASGAGGGGGSLTLMVDDSTANMLMRDVLEREFGRIMRSR